MSMVKTETWNGHDIRFVEKDGEWWAVGSDVAKALEYAKPHKAISDHCPYALTWGVGVQTGTKKDGSPAIQNVEAKIIPELDIYELIFAAAKQSRSKVVKEKAAEFKKWVFEMLKALRQQTGLEGFQVFRMMDKEHQREAMKMLNESLSAPVRKDFIKANTITNKVVSSMYGFEKMLKKNEMTPDMLKDRVRVLDDTTGLIIAVDKYGLKVSVSEVMHQKYAQEYAKA